MMLIVQNDDMFRATLRHWDVSFSPVHWSWGVFNEADHLLFHINWLGFEGKGHFVDKGLDAFAIPCAVQLPLFERQIVLKTVNTQQQSMPRK